MHVEFLQANAVDEALTKLVEEYDEFHWAVAWGSLTDVAKKMLRHPAKLRNVVFGIAFSQTDPNLIDKLVGVKGARVVAKFAGGTFHPKVYGFRSGSKAAAVVGSANCTFGGLGKNLEAAALFEGNADDPFFRICSHSQGAAPQLARILPLNLRQHTG